MVVVTGREPDSRHSDAAMSSSEAEDDFLEPATPTATQAGHGLPLLPQEVPGPSDGGGGREDRCPVRAELTLGGEPPKELSTTDASLTGVTCTLCASFLPGRSVPLLYPISPLIS